MANIVVCGDLEHEIEKTGELSRLEILGSVEIFNELDPSRETLVRRLRGARAVLEFRGRAALDGATLSQLPDLEMIASTGLIESILKRRPSWESLLRALPRSRPRQWPITFARLSLPLRVIS